MRPPPVMLKWEGWYRQGLDDLKKQTFGTYLELAKEQEFSQNMLNIVWNSCSKKPEQSTV